MSLERLDLNLTRRQVLKGTTAGAAGFVLSSTAARWVYAACDRLDPTAQPQFVETLPIPPVIDATGGGTFPIDIRRINQNLGLVSPGGNPLSTKVLGYGLSGGQATYLGPTFVAKKDVGIDVRWNNKAPAQSLLPVDSTVHKGDPKGPDDRVSFVTHLHGARTESPSDGEPEAWFTQNFAQTGPQFVKETYHYHNGQEAATLWYHDHSLGITRLNVGSGLAGFYLLRDDNELGLIGGGVLPSGAFEIGLAIQDRCFEASGDLFMPSSPDDAEVEDEAEVFDPANVTGMGGTNDPITLTFERPVPDPTIVAEFFGDFSLVNGKIWPKRQVTPDLYRFRVLNGSDSRFYVLRLQDRPNGVADAATYPFYVIGSDAGFLAKPAQVSELLIAPAERYDLVVDFRGLVGFDVYLNNYGPDDPFKGFNADGTLSDGEGGELPPADPGTTGRVMKFEVRGASAGSAPAWTGSNTLRAGGKFTVSGKEARTRKLFLFEGLDEFGRLQPMLGTEINTDGTNSRNSRAWFEPITENPGVGDTEIWEVYNTTEDAHPIHVHLVAFQILNRQRIRSIGVREVPQPMAHGGAFGVGKDVVNVTTSGPKMNPAPQEESPKDTVVMLPGQVTRIKMQFSPPNDATSADGTIRYVWHCHIISHEDHEMMRPYVVGDCPAGICQT